MNNTNLLLVHNKGNNTRRIRTENNAVFYENHYKEFNGQSIRKIIEWVNSVINKYDRVKIPMIIDLGHIKIEDKLSYIMLECICYYIIKTHKRKVFVSFDVTKTIWTEGIISSPLTLLTTGSEAHIDKFTQKFNKDIYMRHYRRVITMEDRVDSSLSCKIMADIDSFLKPFDVSKSHRDDISEVVTELADNVNDHTNGDCLIDIDVSELYEKRDDTDGGKYYGLNVVVLNFSDKLFGDAIREKLQQEESLTERYKSVQFAFMNHSKNFGSNYTQEDFYNITSFQHKISGRFRKSATGGTGLTKLIHSLEVNSDTHKCYMISGNKSIYFKQDLITYNEEGWIGFNQKKDYINFIPSENVIGESLIYMPGTAFNLNFAIRKDDNNE